MFLDAAATTAEGAGSISNILTLLMIPLLLIIMYFVMIRPQRKQEKEANNMRNSLSVGDEITTIGGIIGRVVNVKEDTFVLETTKERTRIRFERTAVKRIDRKSTRLLLRTNPLKFQAPRGHPKKNPRKKKRNNHK